MTMIINSFVSFIYKDLLYEYICLCINIASAVNVSKLCNFLRKKSQVGINTI